MELRTRIGDIINGNKRVSTVIEEMTKGSETKEQEGSPEVAEAFEDFQRAARGAIEAMEDALVRLQKASEIAGEDGAQMHQDVAKLLRGLIERGQQMLSKMV